MLYVGIVVLICFGEWGIRRWVNHNVKPLEVKDWSETAFPVRLRNYHNEGMANNCLEKRPQLVKGIGIGVISVITAAFLLSFALRGKKALKSGLALILGGGLANLTERFCRGYVTDYLQFRVPVPFLRRLIFNVADLCVFVGMAVLMLQECRNQ